VRSVLGDGKAGRIFTTLKGMPDMPPTRAKSSSCKYSRDGKSILVGGLPVAIKRGNKWIATKDGWHVDIDSSGVPWVKYSDNPPMTPTLPT
jgi:hypothetical protein